MFRPRPVGERRRPSPTATRGHWWLSGAALVCIAASAFSLQPLLRGSDWWWAMALCAAAVLGVMAVLRQMRAPRPLVMLGGAGALTVILTANFAADTSILGFVPTLGTLGELALRSDEAWASVVVQTVPASTAGALMFLLVAGAGVVALIMDLIVCGARTPALAAIPLLAVATVPGIFLGEGAELLSLLLLGASYLLLLWTDARISRAGDGRVLHNTIGGAVVVGVGALSAALLIGAVNPGFIGSNTAVTSSRAALFGSGINAMTTLGEDLRRPLDLPALRYSSDSDMPVYLGMLVLDRFDGDNWVPGALPVDAGNTVGEVSQPEGLDDTVPREKVDTHIAIVGLRSNWLPVPAAATSVQGLSGDWFWEKQTRAVASFTALTSGQTYAVSSLQLRPTASMLRAARDPVPDVLTPMLEVPAQRPPIIDDTVQRLTAGLERPWDIAVALQAYLRSNEFRYSEKAPVDDGYDGDGLDVTAAFLKQKAGYCVHFASTMTLMARIKNIPARVVIGYQPGSRTSSTLHGDRAYEVSNNDLHAWPELYFGGIGWVAFEPTPTRGAIPGYSLRSAIDLGPTEAGSDSAPTQSPVEPAANRDRPETGAVNGSGATAATAAALNSLGIVLAIALLLLTPGLVRYTRWRARRGAVLRGAGIEPAWREIIDTAIDSGVTVDEAETPRAFAGRLRDRVTDGAADDEAARAASAAIEALLAAVERDRFAAHDAAHAAAREAASAPVVARQMGLVRAVLRSQLPLTTRLRSTLAPPSLLAHRRARAGWRASDA